MCRRHIDGAESRESALKRLEQALADDDFSGFSEHVLRAIGHDTAPPLADGSITLACDNAGRGRPKGLIWQR